MSAEKGLKVCDLGEEVLARIFKFLDEDEIKELCPYLEHMIWQKGEILMNDGEAGNFMGFLLSGKLSVKKETSFPGRFTLVAILDKGAMVGEISLTERDLRTATVAAMETSELLLLSCESLERLLNENSLLGIKILRRIIHVLSLRQRRSYDRLSAIL